MESPRHALPSLHDASATHRNKRGNSDAGALGPKGQVMHMACKRCRARKVKCDGEYPVCTGCRKADVPCIVADYTTPRDYTRAEVYALEQRLSRLKSALAESHDRAYPVTEGEDRRSTNAQEDLSPSHFVGPERGISFLQPVIDILQSKSHSSLTRSVTARGRVSSRVHHVPHPLPNKDTASRIVDEYFRDFHISHPILDKATVYTMMNDIYQALDGQLQDPAPLTSALKKSLVRLNMVFSIGSIKLFRENILVLHPFGFFTAALEAYPPTQSSFNTIEDIENFLLIALFGLYFDIGCSIWELGRLCIRICIELKLHRQYSNPAQSLEHAERCRRVFWESYIIDRLSSSTLGRPFAIDDADIDASLPGTLLSDNGSGSPFADGSPSHSSETMVFYHLILLAKIKSAIHQACMTTSVSSYKSFELATESKIPKPDAIFSLARDFHKRLVQWRRDAPRYSSAINPYETDTLFELSFQEARFGLIRATIDKLPSGTTSPPDALLRSCLQAAHGIILSFDKLKRENITASTRAFAHLILTAGLVILFVLRVQNHKIRHPEATESDVDVSFWLGSLDDGSGFPTVSDCLDTLSTAGNTLTWFAVQMPDIAPYADFFEGLKKDFVRWESSSFESDREHRMVQSNRMSTNTAPIQQSSGQINTTLETSLSLPEPIEMPGILPAENSALDSAQLVTDFGTNGLLAEMFSTPCPGGELLGEQGVGGGASSWPFTYVPWMEGIDSGISGYIWDTMMPWHGSPSTPYGDFT